jgi:hypothetical protein
MLTRILGWESVLLLLLLLLLLLAGWEVMSASHAGHLDSS